MRSRRAPHGDSKLTRGRSRPLDDSPRTKRVPAALLLDSKVEEVSPLTPRLQSSNHSDNWFQPQEGCGQDFQGDLEIPTDDFSLFFMTLVNGMRGDAADLARSTTAVLSNTFQVVVRPLEALASVTKPLFKQTPLLKENAERSQVQLENALSFRMPHNSSQCVRGTVSGGEAAGVLNCVSRNSASIEGRRSKNKTLGAVKLPLSPAKATNPTPNLGFQSPEPRPRQHRRVVSEAWASTQTGEQLNEDVIKLNSSIGISAREGRRGDARYMVGEGSRINLNQLDRSNKTSGPQHYRCKDGGVVILGKQRMVRVWPDQNSPDGSITPSSEPEERRGRRYGTVTWEMHFGEVESCCVSVSAGEESKCQVGDVLVEVISRPNSYKDKPGKQTFCLANPSDCLELLKSIQSRWQPQSKDFVGPVAAAATPVKGGDTPAVPHKSPCSTVVVYSPTKSLTVSEQQGSENASTFKGMKKGVIMLESPAKILREAHEQHERDLKEDLQKKAQSSHANLQRRRRLRRSPSLGLGRSLSPKLEEEGLKERPMTEMLIPSAGKMGNWGTPNKRNIGSRGCAGGEMEGKGEENKLSNCASESGVPQSGESQKPYLDDIVSTALNSHVVPELQPPSPASPAVGAAKGDPRLKKYQMMLKAGVPEGAVRQKMAMEGLDESSIILEVPVNPRQDHHKVHGVPGMAAAMPSQQSQPKTSTPDPALAKYASMLKAGIPPGAVGQKMGMDGLPPSTIASFLGTKPYPSESKGLQAEKPLPPLLPKAVKTSFPVVTGGLPPPPPLPPPPKGGSSSKLRKAVESSTSAVGGEGSGSTAGLPISATNVPSPRSSVPLLNLHWEVLPPAAINRTIWANRANSLPNLAEESEVQELEKLFFKQAVTPKGGGGVGGGFGLSAGQKGRGSNNFEGGKNGREIGRMWSEGTPGEGLKYTSDGQGGGGGVKRVKKVQLLDVSRGNNVAIGLKALRTIGSPEELAGLIEGLDPEDMLSAEDLQRLEVCLPTSPEMEMVLAFQGSPETLGTAESFFWALGNTPRPLAKVRVMLFMQQFKSNSEVLAGRLEALEKACSEATESQRLAGVLERVLRIGNVLNQGTYKGNACGFRLGSLLKLSHTKSNSDKKTSVLHYMVRSVASKVTQTGEPSAELEESGKPRLGTEKLQKCASPSRAGTGLERAGDFKAGGSSHRAGDRAGGEGGRKSLVSRSGRSSAVKIGRSSVPSGGGGGGRGRSVREKAATRVESLDLEAELGNIRSASKVTVAEIVQDLRQLERGLKEVKAELRSMGKDQLEMCGRGGRKGSGAGSGIEKEGVGDGLSVAGNGEAGRRKLEAFVEASAKELEVLGECGERAVARCKDVGEYFGEGANEGQSSHIFGTLVSFLDLLEAAKKVEGVC